jgi:hypothetical protein
MPSGCIASDLRMVTYDARQRKYVYELLLVNDTVAPVAAYAYLDTRASGGMRAWNAVTVDPFAAIAVTVDVPLGKKKEDVRRVVVELHADMAHLTVDAHPPFIPTQTRQRGRVAAGIAALLAVVLGTVGVFARPHVVALAAPERAPAGSRIDVAYATAGGGSWNYKLLTPDGYQVRAGKISSGAGAFAIDVPREKGVHSYDLQVSGAGMLGGDTRVAHIVAEQPHVSGGRSSASISRLALVRDVVNSGQPIIVTYRAHAASGVVQLVGEDGTEYGETAVTSLGTATLTAPQLKRDQQLSVVLTVRKGASTAQSSTGVVVRSALPEYADGFGPDGQPLNDGQGQRRNVRHLPPQGDAPFAMPADPVYGGGGIDIAVVDQHAQLKVKLTTRAGAVLASANAEQGEKSIVLPAPDVDADAPMLIEATYQSAIGEETVIRKITIHRRPAG